MRQRICVSLARLGAAAAALSGIVAIASSANAANEPEGMRPAPAPSSAVAVPFDTAPDSEDEEHSVRRRHWGLMFDLGSMHGGMLSLAYSPAPWLRLHTGAGTNAVSPGYRAGVTLVKPGTGPSLNIEGGHFFPGDINGLLKILVGTGYRANPRLEEFDYNFVNLQAGWEIESDNLTFFVRGGATVLWTHLPVFPERRSARTPVVAQTEPFRLVLPSVALGFVGFL